MLKNKHNAKFICAFILSLAVCVCAISLMFSQSFAHAKPFSDGNQDASKASNVDDKVYNIAVGKSLVGSNESLWVGEGANRHYAYTSENLTYEYYPSNNRLNMISGIIDKYFVYYDQSEKQTFETKGLISVNQIHNKICLDQHTPEISLTNVEKITIDFKNCKNLDITKHKNPVEHNSNDQTEYENGGIFVDNIKETTITGNDNLNIYASETLEYANVYGIAFLGDIRQNVGTKSY